MAADIRTAQCLERLAVVVECRGSNSAGSRGDIGMSDTRRLSRV